MDAGQILLNSGLIDSSQLDHVRDGNGKPSVVVQRAVDNGYVSEAAALKAIGENFGLDFVDLTEEVIDLSLLENFPQKLIYRETLFPIRREDETLYVATSNPFDLYALDEIGSVTGLIIAPILAETGEINKLIKQHLGVGGETIDDLVALKEEEGIELLEELEAEGELSDIVQEASVVRLVNEILLDAINSRASDVHIESQGSGIVIRNRIDGILHPQPLQSEINRFQSAIISRLKIMAKLNIAEKRLPQDGRIKIKVHGREVDLRVSVIPMIHGEGLVLRILDKGSMKFDLRNLGMEQETYERFSKLIRIPHGILLVTGPTGSGKTTTLYSSLLEINDASTKVITTEDPVEYQLDGINQIQVHPKIGLTFAASLRSILRHDPDVVLVGEIRDLETAENAIQASLTGHLVFSTLHTNDAAGAYTRMGDMGVESFLVASTVEAVMAQRLVRRICEHCKEEYAPNHDELPQDFPRELLGSQKLFRAHGCRECRNVGYTGRLGVYELLVTTEEIRQMAHDGASTWEIKKAGKRQGMNSLRDDGWIKVIRGQTTVDEVLRITKADRVVT